MDRHGRSALSVAVIKGHTELVKQLIESGADVNARDYEWNTPLMHAVGEFNLAILDLLIKNNAKFKTYPDINLLKISSINTK